MDLKKKIAVQRDRRDNALKQCEVAETRNKENETLLGAKTQEVTILEERLRLTRELVRIAQRLGSTLEKTSQEEEKLRVLEERADRASTRLQTLQQALDDFQAKYDESRKKMRELESELAGLGLG